MRFVAQIGFAPRLAALYGAFFIVAGISQPFLPVWLKAKGLDPGSIGVVLAAPMLLRILAIPLVMRESDRRDVLREAIVLTSCLSVAGYALLGLSDGVVQILIAYALGSLAFSTMMPLSETYAFKGLTVRGQAYGPVRLWGSATFILGTFAAGFALDLIPARHIIWMVVAAGVLNALVASALMPVSTAVPVTSGAQPPRRSLLRDPAFIAVMAAASLIQASHATYYGFSALAWRSAGLDGMTVAGLWALGVLAEIVLFGFSGQLPPFFQPTVLLMIGALGGALRWSVMALDPPVTLLPFLQLLHALTFGATHLGALGFVARHAPAEQGATAQGYLTIALGAGMAGAMTLSGLLYAVFGSRAYAAMALAAIAGGACAFVAQRARGGVAAL